LAVIYLVVGLFLNHFNLHDIITNFETVKSFYEYNIIYSKFLEIYFGIDFYGLFDIIKYVSGFFFLKIEYTSPVVLNEDDERKYVKYLN
jgi:hypothetical protein